MFCATRGSSLSSIDCRAGDQLRRRGLEMELRPPHRPVEAVVRVGDVALALNVLPQFAAPGATLATHLEDVGEVACERKGQRQRNCFLAMTCERNALVRGAVPKIRGPHDMNHVARQYDMAFEVYVRVGQVGRQGEIVVAYAGAEQQRLHSRDEEFQAGQKASVMIEKSVGAASRGSNIAVTVEDGESVGVLEDTARPGRRT